VPYVEQSERNATLEFVLLLHDRLAVTLILFMFVTGGWGAIAFARGGSLSGSFAGTLAIGQILVMAQVLAGLALIFFGVRPPDPTHYLYGATAILTLPFIWTYARRRDARQALMMYALAALFIFGLGVRGMMTGTERAPAPTQPAAVAASATPTP
jgi:hypothetical protein